MRMLITGAGSGIGRAVALGAVAQGGSDDRAQLVLVDINRAAVEAVAQEVREAGGLAHVAVADLADPAAPGPLVDHAVADLGGLDALVSNAGMVVSRPMTQMTVAEFDLSMAVNARATWLLAIAARDALKLSAGSIVATASASGTHPTPPLAAYCASKAALIMLVKEMALEWAPDGIRCNTVSPGPTATGLTTFQNEDDISRSHLARREALIPLRKVNQPSDVADAILFLAGRASARITGVDLLVDGGISLIPMLASRGGLEPGA